MKDKDKDQELASEPGMSTDFPAPGPASEPGMGPTSEPWMGESAPEPQEIQSGDPGAQDLGARVDAMEAKLDHLKHVCTVVLHALRGVSPAVDDHPGVAEVTRELEGL